MHKFLWPVQEMFVTGDDPRFLVLFHANLQKNLLAKLVTRGSHLRNTRYDNHHRTKTKIYKLT